MRSMTPFVYREFYDVPRMILVSRGPYTFLLDCSFDEEKDEYDTEYGVYLMPEFGDGAVSSDWRALSAKAVLRLGRIGVSEVCFDSTKRKEMDTNVLARFDEALIAMHAQIVRGDASLADKPIHESDSKKSAGVSGDSASKIPRAPVGDVPARDSVE